MTANKAVAEQHRAGVEKAGGKVSAQPTAMPHEKRRALGRGLESLLPRVFKNQGSGVRSQESAAVPAADSRLESAASIEKALTTKDTKGDEGNQESGVETQESGVETQGSGVGSQESAVADSQPTMDSGLGTAAASIENPLTTKDTKRHEGSQESGVETQESAVRGQESAAVPATDSRLGPAAAIENALTTKDTKGHEGNQESGVRSQESAVPDSQPTMDSGLGTAAASIEKALTTRDPKEHEGRQQSGVDNQESGVGGQESGSRLQASAVGLRGAEGKNQELADSPVHADAKAESDMPLPGVIAELQVQAGHREVLKQLPLDLIDPNPYQTRIFTKTTDEDEAGMKELVASIKATGVITPILVRPGKDGRYTLIAGERRTKASRHAGRETIPAIVREVSNQQAAELTVIENLQRENLNCMDQANAFVMLSQNFHMTQDQIGTRVGMSRGTVSNYMRLVRLPEEVQRYLTMNQLTYSHARELLNLEDSQIMLKVARRAVKETMSVEQLEKLIMDEEFGGRKQPAQLAPGRARWVDPNVRAAQRDLERVLGVKVRIRDRKGKGKITLEYATLEDYDRILGMLRGSSS